VQIKPEPNPNVTASYNAWALEQVADDAKEAVAAAGDNAYDEEEAGAVAAKTYEVGGWGGLGGLGCGLCWARSSSTAIQLMACLQALAQRVPCLISHATALICLKITTTTLINPPHTHKRTHHRTTDSSRTARSCRSGRIGSGWLRRSSTR